MARPPLRSLAPWIALAVLGPLALASLGLLGFAFTDYEAEAAPAFAALVHGDFTRFLELCPAYGGSLMMRAPFALAADALGGGRSPSSARSPPRACSPARRSASCSPRACSPAAPAAGRSPSSCGLCAANPITLRALDIGHPEELLGAALCAGAVLAALRGRSTLAGVLLGLAVANKAWAVLAVGPVLLALQADRRRALAIAGAIAAAFMLPLLLTGAASGQPGAAAQTGAIFQPWQVWWFLGATGEVIRGADGLVKEGYRSAPGWVSPLSHPLIVARRAAAVAAGLAPALGPAAAARAAVRAALHARPVEHRLLRAARDHHAGRVGGDAHRAPAGLRARAHDGDVGDVGMGRPRGVRRRRGARLPRLEPAARRAAGLAALRAGAARDARAQRGRPGERLEHDAVALGQA